MREEPPVIRPAPKSDDSPLLFFSLAYFLGLAGGFAKSEWQLVLLWPVVPIFVVLMLFGIYGTMWSFPRSCALSPACLAKWRSIRPGMERHEVIEILGKPDGLPDVVPCGQPFEGKVLYQWGVGFVYFEPHSGPVFHVLIPEYA
jgi:hypothetical protein